MRVLLIGYNDGVLAALDRGWPGGVVVLEEPDLWEAKGLADKARRHPSLGEVHFGRYQQDEHFLRVVAQIGAVDAVAPGLEYAVTAAARAADGRGLPGAGVPAATVLRDKVLLRHATAAAGMPTPRFREITGPDDIADFARGGPCVVKPAGRQASLGVVLLDAGGDVEAAWRACHGADEGTQVANRPMTWRYLVEERLYGPEFSTECLVQRGSVCFVNVTAKRTAAGGRPVEIGHVVPGVAGTGDPADWRRSAQHLVDTVGFGTGMLHAEWVVTDRGPYLIECAGRPPGDRILDLIDLAYETNITQTWLRLLAGQTVTPPDRPTRSAAIRFLTARPGVITGISGVADARRQPGVHRVDVQRKPGDVLADLASSWDRVGSVIAVADSPARAERRAEEISQIVRIQTR